MLLKNYINLGLVSYEAILGSEMQVLQNFTDKSSFSVPLCREKGRLSSRNHHKIGHVNLWQGSGNPHLYCLLIYKKILPRSSKQIEISVGSFSSQELVSINSSIFEIILPLSPEYLLSMPPFHTHLSSCLCILVAVKYFWRSLVRHGNQLLLTIARAFEMFK